MKATLILLAILTFYPPKANAQGVHSISGVVVYDGESFDVGIRQVAKDPEICGTNGLVSDESIVVNGSGGGLKNAVVYFADMEAVPGWGKSVKTVIDQAGCVFTPHVSILALGESLAVTNLDGVLHNIHSSRGNNRTFNLAMPKSLKTLDIAARRFRFPDFVALKCDVHDWMSAVIVVAEHPYYAVTDDDGSFSLADVPPGDYQLVVWHEALMGSAISITVSSEDLADISFAIGERKIVESEK